MISFVSWFKVHGAGLAGAMKYNHEPLTISVTLNHEPLTLNHKWAAARQHTPGWRGSRGTSWLHGGAHSDRRCGHRGSRG